MKEGTGGGGVLPVLTILDTARARRAPSRSSGSWVARERSKLCLSADDYDAELAERYDWTNRALPANDLDEFVTSLAHRTGRGFSRNQLVDA